MRASNVGRSFGKDDGGGSANPDPTMKELPRKPGDENVPPKGGESMGPADSKHPYAKSDEARAETEEPGT